MNYIPSDFENDINKWNNLSKYNQECRECWEDFLQPEYFYCSKCRNKYPPH